MVAQPRKPVRGKELSSRYREGGRKIILVFCFVRYFF